MTAMPTAPRLKLMTAAEFAARPADSQPEELIEGVVKELPMPEVVHGKMSLWLGAAILYWAAEHDAGHVADNDSRVRTRTDPDTVRGPDVCYFSYARVPRGPFPAGIAQVAPDLVVEVRSPSDRWNAVIAKTAEYLAAGVTVVIVVNPQNESVVVYRDAEAHQTFYRAETLTVPDVLPGFTFPVARLFS